MADAPLPLDSVQNVRSPSTTTSVMSVAVRTSTSTGAVAGVVAFQRLRVAGPPARDGTEK
jgi:hypothetical protein